MTIRQLETKLSNIVKKDILDYHYDTGLLYDTIYFKCKWDSDVGISIELISEEYIEYLEQGTYLQYLMDLPEVEDLISEFVSQKIVDDFYEDFS